MASIEKIKVGGVEYDLAASGNFVEKTGDTMTGDLAMSSNNINGVAAVNFDSAVIEEATNSDGSKQFYIGNGDGNLRIEALSLDIEAPENIMINTSMGDDRANITLRSNINSQTELEGGTILITATSGDVSLVSTTNANPNNYYATDGTIQPIPTPGDPNQNAFSKVKVGSTTINSSTTTDTLELVAGTNVTLTPTANTKKVTIAASGESNQNAFSNVKVGSTTIAANAKTDTLNLVAGSNITLTPNASGKSVTISASGGSTGNFLPLSGGTMTGSIIPDTHATIDFGKSTVRWNKGYFTYVESTNGFFQRSDKNLKNIHGEIDLYKAYDLIDKCSTILYDLKDDPKHQEQIGVIAQEIEEFFPEIVVTDENGLKSVDYARLTVVIMKVLKDLMYRVTKLERK